MPSLHLIFNTLKINKLCKNDKNILPEMIKLPLKNSTDLELE
jgi:hypothetical protein